MFDFLRKKFAPAKEAPRPAPIIAPKPTPVASAAKVLPLGWENGVPTDDLGPPGDQYPQLFKLAIERSRAHGLFSDELQLEEGSILNKNSIKRAEAALRTLVIEVFDGDASNMAVQCFNTCMQLSRDLAGKYRLDPVITLGSTYGYKGRMFGIDVDTLELAIEKRAQARGGSADMHAWLTFPTGEIIDPTLLTSVSVHGFNIGVEAGPKKLVYGHPRNFTKLRYEPHIVGEEVFVRLGMVRGFMFR